MGSVTGSSEQELEGHIEVACTAHASTGVRRLVKSVVRGIKVGVQQPQQPHQPGVCGGPVACGSTDSNGGTCSGAAVEPALGMCHQHKQLLHSLPSGMLRMGRTLACTQC